MRPSHSGCASARATFTPSHVKTSTRPSVWAKAARIRSRTCGIPQQRLAPVTGGEHLPERLHLVEQERVVEREEHLHLLQLRLRVHAVTGGARLVDELQPALPPVAHHRQRSRWG